MKDFSHSIGEKLISIGTNLYADWMSVPVPRTSSLRELDVGFIPLVPKELPYMGNKDEYSGKNYVVIFFVGFNFWSRLSLIIPHIRFSSSLVGNELFKLTGILNWITKAKQNVFAIYSIWLGVVINLFF